MPAPTPFLIGSTFPLSLVRRRVVIEPRSLGELITVVHERPFASFWGHDNTVEAASTIVSADLRPHTARPAVILDLDKLPTLDGQVFAECWVLSPEYIPGFRPQIGEEVGAEKITGWQVLRIEWTESTTTL